MYDVKPVSFSEFKNLANGKEGIVLYGCGGSLDEWIDGIAKILHDEQISTAENASQLFTEMYILDKQGRHDLALVMDFDKVNLGKMRIWRIAFGDCSWISDYIPNNDPTNIYEIHDDD